MPDPICADCAKTVTKDCRRGRCERCYRKHIALLKSEGTYAPVPRTKRSKSYRPRRLRPVAERALNKVTPGWGGCWLFTGKVDRDGYAITYRSDGRSARAGRAVYEAVVGEIGSGLELDHLCHSTHETCVGGSDCVHRRCINPAHLEPVTAAENTYRSNGPSGINARKTHCLRGHAFTPENTRISRRARQNYRPARICIQCSLDRSKGSVRGLGPGVANAAKTHCLNGHEFTPENTQRQPPNWPGGPDRRGCRRCISERRYVLRQRAKEMAR